MLSSVYMDQGFFCDHNFGVHCTALEAESVSAQTAQSGRICTSEQAKVWCEKSSEGRMQAYPLARGGRQGGYPLARGGKQGAHPLARGRPEIACTQ